MLKTTCQSLLEFSQKTPGKPAIIVNGETITYSNFTKRINFLASNLEQIEPARKRKHVIICCGDKLSFLTSIFACFSINVVAVPAGTDDPGQLRFLIDHSQSALLLFDSTIDPKVIEEISLLNINTVNVEEAKFEEVTLKPIEPSPEDIALLFYSSGTTSKERKGTLLNYQILNDTTSYMNKVMNLSSEIIEFVVAPLNHAFGFGRIRAVFDVGGTIVLQNGNFNPAQVILSLEKHKCNAVSSVSSGFSVMIDYYKKHLRNYGTQIKWVEIGSLPLSPSHKKELMGILPRANIFMNYGLTEAMRSTFLHLNKNCNKINTVGKASPGVEIAILDDEGIKLPLLEEGEIAVRGVNLTKGYWKDVGLFKQKTESGFFRTGDIGYLDTDGFLTFLGRKDDAINCGGHTFYPSEVEHALKSFLDTPNFCISSTLDRKGILGEVPVLCIENNTQCSLDDIQSLLRNTIDDYKIPRKIIYVDEFPKTYNGKIKRRLLKNKITQSNKDFI